MDCSLNSIVKLLLAFLSVYLGVLCSLEILGIEISRSGKGEINLSAFGILMTTISKPTNDLSWLLY